jgi:hypothetical protein
LRRRWQPETDLTWTSRKSESQNAARRREEFPDRISSVTFQQMPSSHAQTAATLVSGHSEYQAGAVSGLPSARSWPSGATIPCQTRLDYDLLGLNQNLHAADYSPYTTTAYSGRSLQCPHHQSCQPDLAGGSSAPGLGGIDRFIAETPSEHGTVYFREDVLHRVSDGYCYCLGTW